MGVRLDDDPWDGIRTEDDMPTWLVVSIMLAVCACVIAIVFFLGNTFEGGTTPPTTPTPTTVSSPTPH